MILPFAFAIWFGVVGHKHKRNWFVYALAGAAMHVVIALIVSYFITAQMGTRRMSMDSYIQFTIINMLISGLISLFVGDMILKQMLDNLLTPELKVKLEAKLKEKRASGISYVDCINYMMGFGMRKVQAKKVIDELELNPDTELEKEAMESKEN